jgi:hypothetical protein
VYFPLCPLPYTLLIHPFCVIMSQSQHSDFTSSLYDGDTDNISYLASSSLPELTPELSSSQQAFESFNAEFLRLLAPPTIPPSFTRLGPDRRKAYVLYDLMAHSEWVEWWLQTDYGKKSKLHWDANHQSPVWGHFHQVAHGPDGAPKVMCKECGTVLEHPSTTLSRGNGKQHRQGTSTMTKHLNTASCRKAGKGKKAEITRFLQKAVSQSSTSFLIRQLT